MVRFLGFTIVAFLLPFVLYGGWRFLSAGIVPGREAWPGRVWLRLTGIGVAAMLVAIAILVSVSGDRTGKTYHPARVQDGQLVPGGFD